MLLNIFYGTAFDNKMVGCLLDMADIIGENTNVF